MQHALDEKDYDSCVILAVHAAISAADSLCVFESEERYAGTQHREAVLLFRSLDDNKNHTRRLENLIALKTDAEYGDRPMKKGEAERAVKDANRFLEFVQTRILRQI